ncbi:MAG: acetylxylan esterase [Bacteroidales bacterium]|nr:acetylxylan esterase [Bacteroidales bacterium]
MTKRLFGIVVSASLILAISYSCTPVQQDGIPGDEQTVDPSTLDALVVTAPIPENNFIFEGKPQFVLKINNKNTVPISDKLSIKVLSDKKKTVTSSELGEFTVPANTTIDKDITLDFDFQPGFYKAQCSVEGRTACSVNFGISPTKIVSAPDMQEDFTSFWEDAIYQLENMVQMNPKITALPGRTNMYLVEMNSIPDNVTGEDAVIHAYLSIPKDASATKKYPVLIHFFGYDDQKPSGKLSGPSVAMSFIELYVSTRGQMINNRTADQRSDGIDEDYHNNYGDWFAYNFGQKGSYYYRGAYMDCVQAVRFIATLEEADTNNIFAEGNSQGGAFSYACAALSPIPLAGIAPGVAFMGDFPDYFQIVDWPASTARANKGSMTDEEMYAFLSYFDTKNLATRVSCPIMATMGLKDTTCPPHTNIAPFNNAKTPAEDKVMYYYADMGHQIAANWDVNMKNFFKNHMK